MIPCLLLALPLLLLSFRIGHTLHRRNAQTQKLSIEADQEVKEQLESAAQCLTRLSFFNSRLRELHLSLAALDLSSVITPSAAALRKAIVAAIHTTAKLQDGARWNCVTRFVTHLSISLEQKTIAQWFATEFKREYLRDLPSTLLFPHREQNATIALVRHGKHLESYSLGQLRLCGSFCKEHAWRFGK